MLEILWVIPALPFVAFLLLAVFGKRFGRAIAGWIGAGFVGCSALLTLVVGLTFLSARTGMQGYSQTLWTWMNIGAFRPTIGFRLDALSLLMMFVVTFVGFLIHLYSLEFMKEDEGFSRFFAYMNLFVGSMLVLVLADNLLLLYVGWEGVGLCSYLLIGFWYRDPANGRAARKAFVVTRVGDTAFSIALFILFWNLGSLNIQEILALAPTTWASGSGIAVAAAALLLGGAVGKSAQLPLQTWLPDAMAGPTPVSALIHAATMVTAGVYLIARMNVVFGLAPTVQNAVAIVGALTLLLAGFSALTQRDIKRVLAYSTISQIGYMFLALGVGAYSAAMFHFMTHAFFKALLFLGAGVIIHCLHHEHDMFRMGGLRGLMRTTYWTFLAGSASLSALPLVTAGFYSKDMIIWEAWASPQGSTWLWLAGITGAFITALYTFRMVFVTFFGEAKMQPDTQPGMLMRVPLMILAALSIVGGFIETPATLGHVTLFSGFLHSVFPSLPPGTHDTTVELLLQLVAAAVVLGGIYAAYLFYVKRTYLVSRWMSSPLVAGVHGFWYNGWGFDRLYDLLVVRPYVWFANTNRRDAVDAVFSSLALLARSSHALLSRTQNGRVRTYAAAVAVGAIILVAAVLFR